MTIPLIPSKTHLAAFTTYTRYFMIPLNSKLLSCFPAIQGCYTMVFPVKSRDPSTATPGAVQQLWLTVCFWAPIFFPAPLQPYKQRGKKSVLGCWAVHRAARRNPVHIAVPDRRSHVIPGSLGMPRQLPPWAEVRMLINSQMKGSCWVVINICH